MYIFRIVILLSILTNISFQVKAENTAKRINLDSNWFNVQLDIGELVSLPGQFHDSFCTFVDNHCFEYAEDFLLVPESLNEDLAGVRVVHIKGDLNADITLGQHSELVIGGDVTEQRTIYLLGLSKIYIGGNFYGKIESTGMTHIYVMGDFEGTLYTGSPSTHLVVKRDFKGLISPTAEKGAILTVKVKGHADMNFIEPIYEHTYTIINGFFGSSTKPPGVYLLNTHNLTISQ